MKKILVMSPNPSDPNSFWRCMGPMSYMAKNAGYDLFVAQNGVPYQWDTMAKFDVVFMHRPCRPEDLTCVQMARQLNIPVWVDYDDWLYNLPPWNPTQGIYHNVNLQMNMSACVAAADVVSVSTGPLAKMLMKLNSKTIILPNAYRTDLFRFRQETVLEREPYFYWRGTNTHEGDLLSVKDAMSELPAKVKFIGNPGFLPIHSIPKDRMEMVGAIGNFNYWRAIYEMRGKVMVFPLDDCFFNHCKSNIAWIEAIHAGSIIVAPDMPEWHHLGVIGYKPNDAKSFHEACTYAYNMPENDLAKMNKDAYEYMRAKFGIETVNKLREAVMASLLSPTFERNQTDPFLPGFGLWALNKMKEEASQTPNGT